MTNHRIFIALIVAVSFAVAGCGGTESSGGKKTEGELLAEIENGGEPGPEDPTVQKFEGQLAKLRGRCRVQSGGASLADMVVNVEEALKKHGHDESVGEVLENMSETTPTAKKVGVTCTEAFALYLDLREHE